RGIFPLADRLHHLRMYGWPSQVGAAGFASCILPTPGKTHRIMPLEARRSRALHGDMFRFSVSHIALTLGLILLGGISGALCAWIGLPLPYLLGPMLGTGLIVGAMQHRFPDGYVFPMKLRMVFIGAIGAMIGARFTPEILAMLPRMAISIPVLIIVVGVVHWLNVIIFQRLGGIDRVTAYYSGAPGGMYASLVFGEQAGADLTMLTLLQFLRVIAVVTIVPFAMSLWEGHLVGSAAGLSFGSAHGDLISLPILLAISVLGVVLGERLKLPAAQLVGPLFLAALVTLTGITVISPPEWVLPAAQVVVGVALGMRFTGMTGRLMLKATALSLVSVTVMMLVGVIAAIIVTQITGLPTDMLAVAYAPGGVVEMSLIGLSLAAEPTIITLHHLVRILVAIGELSLANKLGWMQPKD
ncbi:MAG: AbrB family transcriptional regulator, partial [Maritimibacter sp.]